jgi:hypothetical protein
MVKGSSALKSYETWLSFPLEM